MSGPDADFWQNRFESGSTPWDRGEVHPQLARWMVAGELRPGERVAVPGCGSGYELAALAEAGCAAIGIDYAPAAVARSRERLARVAPPATTSEVIQADVLEWSPTAPLDVVYEQTCLCALHPDHWQAYAARLHAWLRPGGRLLVLAMQAPREGAGSGFIEGPPYHTDINALRALLPQPAWEWPRPPYERVPHPRNGWAELAIALKRR